MPVLTLGQLSKALATGNPSNQSTFFMEPGGVFTSYVNEMGPRLYAMGMWPGLLTVRTYAGADGYFSLCRDIEVPVNVVVNDRPQKVNAQFHDMRFYGNTSFLPEAFGLIDQGFHAERRDIQTIQGATTYDDITPVTSLAVTTRAGAAVPYATLADAGAVISIVGYDADSNEVAGTLTDGSPEATIEFSPGINCLKEIVATDVPFALQLRTDVADEDTIVTEIAAGTDVTHYRRFRIGGYRDDTFVHVLGKRAWTDLLLPTDIVWLGNTAAWKHALLTKVAEDTGDAEKAEYHWGKVKSILNDELAAHQGSARPVPTLDFNAGSAPIHNLY